MHISALNNTYMLSPLHYHFPGYFTSVLEMYLNSQTISSSDPVCSQCKKIRTNAVISGHGLFGISVNGKILDIVTKDNISSTCISSAFRKTGVSFVINGIVSKNYLAPPLIYLSNKAKDLKCCQTIRKSTGS